MTELVQETKIERDRIKQEFDIFKETETVDAYFKKFSLNPTELTKDSLNALNDKIKDFLQDQPSEGEYLHSQLELQGSSGVDALLNKVV
jgi:transposase